MQAHWKHYKLKELQRKITTILDIQLLLLKLYTDRPTPKYACSLGYNIIDFSRGAFEDRCEYRNVWSIKAYLCVVGSPASCTWLVYSGTKPAGTEINQSPLDWQLLVRACVIPLKVTTTAEKQYPRGALKY